MESKRHKSIRPPLESFGQTPLLKITPVRAGHAFTTGLSLIADELGDPVAKEFQQVYDQQNLGLSVRDALTNLAVRMPLPDVRIFVSALQVQRESGGNLAEVLDNIAHVIRERFQLMRQIRVYTAEGRMSMYFLMGMPPITGLIFFVMRREYMMLLFTDPIGHRMIAAAVVLQFLGFLVISRIVRLKV